MGGFFPVGQVDFATIARAARSRDIWFSMVKGFGLYEPFHTHRLALKPEGAIPLPETVEGTCRCSSNLGAFGDALVLRLGRLYDYLKDPTTPRPTPEALQLSAYLETLYSRLEPVRDVDPNNPFIMASVDPAIIGGHSEIFNPRFLISNHPQRGQAQPGGRLRPGEGPMRVVDWRIPWSIAFALVLVPAVVRGQPCLVVKDDKPAPDVTTPEIDVRQIIELTQAGAAALGSRGPSQTCTDRARGRSGTAVGDQQAVAAPETFVRLLDGIAARHALSPSAARAPTRCGSWDRRNSPGRRRPTPARVVPASARLRSSTSTARSAPPRLSLARAPSGGAPIACRRASSSAAPSSQDGSGVAASAELTVNLA